MSFLEGKSPLPSLPRSSGGEPLTLSAAIFFLVQAVVYGVGEFGLELTSGQIGAVMLTTSALLALLVALGLRRLVQPVDSVLAYKREDGVIVAGAASSSDAGTPVEVRPAVERFPLQDPPRHLAD